MKGFFLLETIVSLLITILILSSSYQFLIYETKNLKEASIKINNILETGRVPLIASCSSEKVLSIGRISKCSGTFSDRYILTD